MGKIKRKLYFKKIGDLTQREFELLFNIPTDITAPSFRKILEPIAEHSISDINIEEYKINELNFSTAYILGMISGLKTKIPENHLIALFGESGCGKSHLINLIYFLQQMDLSEITEEDRVFLGFAPQEYEADMTIRELKEMADSITIIQKKATRPSRDGKGNKPEIQEGLSWEEVQKCDWTYTMSSNLYGISKTETDEALEKGDAIVIVNDPKLKIMKILNETYPENFLPVQVYRTINKEQWKEMMKKDGRSNEEIEKRIQNFGFSTKMDVEIWCEMKFPDVIFNIDEYQIKNKDLLLQLKAAIDRKDRRVERGISR